MDQVTAVVRSLRVLEPLIREYIVAGDEASKDAGEPHYRMAAPLLLEAKEAHFQGNTAGFYDWAQKKFGKSRTQTTVYLSYAQYAQASVGKSLKSLHELRYTPKSQGGLGHAPPSARTRSWTAPVDAVADLARKEAFRLVQEDVLSRAQERDAERKLASRLVDIGYKVLAKELHPDKMHGNKEAMQRLVRVRDKLKHSI
jgi:hypothetical protein